jgi:hypothetical protein
MAGDRKDPPYPPEFPFMPPGFPFFMGSPFPFVPPDLWVQTWLPMVLGYYRELLQWYKTMIEEWNKEKVDDSLRLMGNEFLRSSLASLQASREVRAKLTQFQIESLDSYVKFLDRLAGAAGQPKP